MSEERYAVLIGNSSFPAEAKLPSLRYPENDVDALDELLTSGEHGIFSRGRTFVLKNRPSQEVRERVNEVLSQAERDDLVLIYYAGHGKLNRRGKLHLATIDTRLATLEATSFPVSGLRDFIEISRSKRIVVILDCCYSGAAGEVFTRGTPDDSLQQFASGRGIHVMTASTGIQVAEERESDRHGVFTKHLLEGIKGGGADQNGDGLVGVDELYRYVHHHVLEDGAQEPTMLNLERAGELIVARSGRKPREERNRQIEAKLFRLAQEGAVTRRQVLRVLRVLEVPADRLAPEQQQQLVLLDRWMEDKVGVGELIESWARLATDDSASIRLPAPGRFGIAAAPDATAPEPVVAEQPAPARPVTAPPAAPPPVAAVAYIPPVPAAEPSRARAKVTLQAVLATLRQAPAQALARGLEGRLGLSLLLAVVFLANLLETNAETWVSGSRLGSVFTSWGNDFAWASQRFESWLGLGRGLNFLDHDAAPQLSVFAYSSSYFFVFPLLCLGVAFALARHRAIAPFRVYALALTADYALTLPFFLLLPVPERWAYPDSGAILLSDRWSSHLIDAFRPMSGLDNCFPSFHVSMTVIAILVCFRFRARLRLAVLGLGMTVVLSTLVLGIHWLGDMIAGAALATLSVALAAYLDARLGARQRHGPCREESPAVTLERAAA